MKISKFFMIAMLVAFLALMVGIYIGRSHQDGTLSVIVDEQSDDIGKININTATVDELCLLPGISEITAQRIIDYREEYGPFSYAEDLCLISGISEKKLEQIIDYIVVN